MEHTKPLKQFIYREQVQQCPICYEVPHFDHYVEASCGHIFCSTHKPQTYTTYRTCRRKIEKYFNSAFVKRTIMNWKLHCDHYKSGCEWSGEWSNLKGHLKSCQYVPTQCKWEKCEHVQQSSTIQQHESNCEWRIVKCEYCNSEMPFKSVSVTTN
jgi:hypothetical protein